MAIKWGYALSGFASGLSTGLEFAKVKALKAEQKRLEESQKEAERIFQEWYDSPSTKEFCDNLDTASQGERAYFITGIRKMSKDVFEYFTEIDNDIREGNIEAAKSKNDLLEQKIKSATDLAKLGMVATFPDGSPMKISPEDIQFQKQIQIGKMAGGPTGEAMGKRMWEKRGFGEITPTPKAPAITDYNTATNYLESISNVSPENFELARKDIEGKFGIDTSYITQDMYKEMNTATKKFYKTAEEAIANSPDIKGLTKQPVQISLNQWKVDYTKAEQTPEEEMRKYYQKQFGTFKRNLLSGINDLGFIIDPENRDKYLSMNFEEYMQFMQGEIPARFGDDITVTDQATGKEQSVKGETLFDKILNKLGLQKIPETEEVGGALGETVSPTEFQPEVTGVETPKLGETIPTPKVPTEGKEALIPMMTKEELHDAMLNTDRSDPLWNLLYKEAVKRGYIIE